MTQGVSNSDNNTSVVQPRFTVSLAGTSAVANDVLELLDSGGTVIGQVVLDSVAVATGGATVTPTGTFADGSVLVRARIKDRAGKYWHFFIVAHACSEYRASRRTCFGLGRFIGYRIINN
jgi:hypothetical protein